MIVLGRVLVLSVPQTLGSLPRVWVLPQVRNMARKAFGQPIIKPKVSRTDRTKVGAMFGSSVCLSHKSSVLALDQSCSSLPRCAPRKHLAGLGQSPILFLLTAAFAKQRVELWTNEVAMKRIRSVWGAKRRGKQCESQQTRVQKLCALGTLSLYVYCPSDPQNFIAKPQFSLLRFNRLKHPIRKTVLVFECDTSSYKSLKRRARSPIWWGSRQNKKVGMAPRRHAFMRSRDTVKLGRDRRRNQQIFRAFLTAFCKQ